MKKLLLVPAVIFLIPNFFQTLDVNSIMQKQYARMRPVGPPALAYSGLRTEPYEVAKVFGRANGCQDVPPTFVDAVTRAGIGSGISPTLLAAQIAVESNCDIFATSSRGALGLMQVRPQIWRTDFDFTRVNLLNPRENLATGSKILASLIAQYGTEGGLRKYNGTGVGCKNCDADYAPKILALARRTP